MMRIKNRRTKRIVDNFLYFLLGFSLGIIICRVLVELEIIL
jgi:hypothetical protein